MSERKKQNPIAALIVLGLVVWGCYALISSAPETPPTANDALQTGKSDRFDTPATETMIAGMADLPEVAWVERDRNNVYIGLSEVPPDIKSLGNAWALQFNREWDFGAHLWFVPAEAEPGDVSRVYRQVSARHEEIR